MTHNELLSKRIQTEHGLFRPIYTYTEEKPIYDEENNIIDYELIGYVETMTAEEHYQKWLYDRENPQPQEPNLADKISILEADVTAQTLENQAQASDISANTEMIFMTMDAATELNESGLQNTQMVLVSMDALTEINEQLILLQEEVTKLKGGIL